MDVNHRLISTYKRFRRPYISHFLSAAHRNYSLNNVLCLRFISVLIWLLAAPSLWPLAALPIKTVVTAANRTTKEIARIVFGARVVHTSSIRSIRVFVINESHATDVVRSSFSRWWMMNHKIDRHETCTRRSNLRHFHDCESSANSIIIYWHTMRLICHDAHCALHTRHTLSRLEANTRRKKREFGRCRRVRVDGIAWISSYNFLTSQKQIRHCPILIYRDWRRHAHAHRIGAIAQKCLGENIRSWNVERNTWNCIAHTYHYLLSSPVLVVVPPPPHIAAYHFRSETDQRCFACFACP